MSQQILPSPLTYCTSWSGGKDACFSHLKAFQEGGEPACILSMLKDEGEQTGAHGLHRTVLEAQAECLGLPIIFGRAGFNDYEKQLNKAVDKAINQFEIKVDKIKAQGVCPTGEDGEFHTLVLDAPCFNHRLKVRDTEICEDQRGYLQLKVMPY